MFDSIDFGFKEIGEVNELSADTDDDDSKEEDQEAYCDDLVSRVTVKSELKLNFLVSFKDIEAGIYNA